MTGRATVVDEVPGLAPLLQTQHGTCTRAQLSSLGIGHDAVDDHVRARRWQALNRKVLVSHLGPLVPPALRWAAVLSASGEVALGSWTALDLHGLRGWGFGVPPTASTGSDGTGTGTGTGRVHIVVPRGCRPLPSPDVVVHESRRFRPEDTVRLRDLPVHSVARSTIDAAAWQRWPRTAVGLMAAVVQQRLATPDALLTQLEIVGRVRHARLMQLALGDLAGGSESHAEIDFVRLCRDAGLPAPSQQVRRRDAQGRWRYLDVVWDLPGGRRLVVEIDGVGHMEEARWYDDLLRAAELGTDPRTVTLRLPAAAARLEPGRVLAIVRRHLAPAIPAT